MKLNANFLHREPLQQGRAMVETAKGFCLDKIIARKSVRVKRRQENLRLIIVAKLKHQNSVHQLKG